MRRAGAVRCTPFQMVDARMRKDLRAAKASGAKGKGSKKKAGKGNKKPSRKPQSA